MPWVHLDIAGTAYYRKATAVRATWRDRRVARHARGARAGRPGVTAGGSTRSPRRDGAAVAGVEPLSLVLGAAGAALGVVADRFATRWPRARREEHPPGRRGRLADRRVRRRRRRGPRAAADPVRRRPARAGRVRGVVRDADRAAWPRTSISGLLPDELTLPVIPIALVYAVSGLNPLVGGELLSGGAGGRADPGRAVPAVDPVRGRGVRAWRRQAAGRDRACCSVASGPSAGRSSGCVLAGVVLLVLLADAAGRARSRTCRSGRSSSSGRCGRCSSAPRPCDSRRQPHQTAPEVPVPPRTIDPSGARGQAV